MIKALEIEKEKIVKEASKVQKKVNFVADKVVAVDASGGDTIIKIVIAYDLFPDAAAAARP